MFKIVVRQRKKKTAVKMETCSALNISMLHCMRPHRGRRRRILLPNTINCNNNSLQSDHVTSTTIPHSQLPYNNNTSKICLNFSKKYYYSFAHVIFGVLLLVINFSSCSCRGLNNNQNSDRPDFICNNDGSHKCVCNRFSGNFDNVIPECTQFLGVSYVPAIKIILHKVNLEAHLHTNETYQQYFRRRIANLISQFCERQAHECPGTPLRIPKVEIETTTKLFLDDEYEPPITQDNVVILRVNFLDHDQTELFFVVTKDTHVQTLSQDSLMEPSKIKLILSAQIGPLSRVLGGVHIHELELGEVHRIATLYNDNSKMIKFVFGICIFLGIIYSVAVVKCLKQTRKNRRSKRKREKENKYGPSYGACTEKLLSDCEKRNGKPKSTSIVSRESISSENRRIKKISEVITPTLKTPTYDDDQPSLDARSFNRMFACDPSQLPAEYHRKSTEQDDDSVNILLPSPLSTAKSIIPTKDDSSMPSVIFISSGTPDTIRQNVPKIEMLVDSPEPTHIKIEPTHAPALLETTPIFNPYERPLSRRGSRNSTPEEGEEFAENREDTPQPLGDEASIVQKLENLPKPPPADVVNDEPNVAKSHTAHKFGHWSSDSESENEVYQRLSEVSEGEEDEVNSKRKKRKIQKNASSDFESMTSEEEDKNIDEEEVLERHQYERLQESPTPSKPPLPDMSFELDSALQ